MLLDIQALLSAETMGSIHMLAADGRFNIVDCLTGLVVTAIVWRFFRPVRLGYLEAVALKPDDVPPDVRAFFDRQDEALRRPGFSPVGDYQTVHGKCPNYARFYSCPQADVFIEVDVYRKLESGWLRKRDFRGTVCVSVFEDGTSLHTGDISLPDGGAHAPPQLVFRGRPDMTLEAMIVAHRRDVAEYAAQHHTAVLKYPPEQLANISVYYTQYQRRYFVDKGVIPPPEGFERTRALIEAEAETPALSA